MTTQEYLAGPASDYATPELAADAAWEARRRVGRIESAQAAMAYPDPLGDALRKADAEVRALHASYESVKATTGGAFSPEARTAWAAVLTASGRRQIAKIRVVRAMDE